MDVELVKDHIAVNAWKYWTVLIAIAFLGGLQLLTYFQKTDHATSWPVGSGEILKSEVNQTANQMRGARIFVNAEVRYHHNQRIHVANTVKLLHGEDLDHYRKQLAPGNDIPIRINPENDEVIQLDLE